MHHPYTHTQHSVIYSSATGASEPAHLAYMQRLLAPGFSSASEMASALGKAGLGSLELFSLGLKATGCSLSRTLSYRGAEFQLLKIPLEARFRERYARAAAYWQLLFGAVSAAAALTRDGKGVTAVGKLYWSASQRFFKLMLMAAKVPACIEVRAFDCVMRGFRGGPGL